MKKFLAITIIVSVLILSGCSRRPFPIESTGNNNTVLSISTTEEETSPIEENRELNEVRQMYKNFIDSEHSYEYFLPIDDYDPINDEEYYIGEKYDGNRRLMFIDLDNNGDEECILIVRFISEECLPYSLVYIFDIYGGLIKCIFSTNDCGVHRSQEKFAVIENDEGLYRIHLYITDPHTYYGTIYRYDGSAMVLQESYYCDRNLGENAYYAYVRSTTKDLLIDDVYLDNGEINPQLEWITEEEFYNTWNMYDEDAVLAEPDQKFEF